MSSPVGHALAGLSVAAVADAGPEKERRALMGLGAFAGVAPDLDFLPGLLAGTPNLFHPSVTHTLGGLLVFTAAVAAVCLCRRSRGAAPPAVAALAYGSHLLLDFFAYRGGPEILWPLDVTVSSPVVLPVMGIRHGAEADGLLELAEELLTWHNAVALGLELALFLPALGAVLWWRRRRRRAAARE